MSLPVTAEPLPSTYTFGKVVGRVIHLIADTAEDTDDRPQARAAAGRVTFAPKEVLRKTTGPDYPAIVLHATESANLSSSGRVLDAEGRQGIWLAVGIYTVTFEITGAARAIPSFDIEVTSAHTDEAPLDLAAYVPYVPPTGTVVQTVVIPTGGTIGQVLVRNANGGLVWADQTGGGGTVVDATASVKGIIQLAGDLGGTAAAPTVPGLASKVNSSTYTAGLAAKADAASLATVATTGAYSDLTGKPTIPAAYTDAQAVTATAPSVAAAAYTGTLKGAWAGNTAYAIGDVVTAEAGLFRAASAHTSNAAGFRYDRNFWEVVPLPALSAGTSVPIRQVDQTNIGTGLTTPRAGLFQRPQKQFNYLAERVIWAWNTTAAVTASGTSVTAANGTMPGGSVVLTRATGTGPMRATSQVLTTPINLSGDTEHLRIPVKITTATTSAYLNIYLSSGGATFTNALKRTVIAADPPPFGWRTYSIPLSEFTVQGTGADLTAINAIQVEYDSGAAGDKMEVSRVTRHPNVAAKAAVSLWFDDGNLTNQSAAIDIATRFGLPVTLAHIADTYTAAGSAITADKARYLQDFAGGQIAVHAFGTVDHDRPQDGAALLEQMLDYQHFGLALGLKGIEDAAYYNTGFPGVKTAEMELVARKLFRSARATGAAYPETLPPGDPLRTRAFMPPASSTFAGYYQPLINRTITSKGLLQLVWHSMNATDLTEFTNLCTYLDANRATVSTTTPARAFDPLCT